MAIAKPLSRMQRGHLTWWEKEEYWADVFSRTDVATTRRLSELTGLPKETVINELNELVERDIVAKSGYFWAIKNGRRTEENCYNRIEKARNLL